MKKILNTDKLSEKLFLLSEYQYYNPSLNEAPEDEEMPEDDMEAGDDLEDTEGEEDMVGLEDEGGEDLEDEELGDDLGGEDLGSEEEFVAPEEEEVEVDVSGIVDGINANADKITSIDQKMASLGNTIETSINRIIQNNEKIAGQISQMEKNLNQELMKRAPTPNEELMMRSMSSYPYNQQLTDYWKPAKGEEYSQTIENPRQDEEPKFDVHVKKEEKPQDFNLTDKEIEEDYSEYDVKNSL